MILERLSRAWAAWCLRDSEFETLVRDLRSEIDDLKLKLASATDHDNVIAEAREQNASLTLKLLGMQGLARERMKLLDEIEDKVCKYRSSTDFYKSEITSTNRGE
jgi:hypothetical protein